MDSNSPSNSAMRSFRLAACRSCADVNCNRSIATQLRRPYGNATQYFPTRPLVRKPSVVVSPHPIRFPLDTVRVIAIRARKSPRHSFGLALGILERGERGAFPLSILVIRDDISVAPVRWCPIDFNLNRPPPDYERVIPFTRACATIHSRAFQQRMGNRVKNGRPHGDGFFFREDILLHWALSCTPAVNPRGLTRPPLRLQTLVGKTCL